MKVVELIASQLPIRLGLQDRSASHTSDTNISANQMTGAENSHAETSSFLTAPDASGATPTREGVFLDIANFLESKNTDVLSNFEYKAAYDACMEPGCVIYLNDEDKPTSRVDRRVMLMVKKCFSSSYMCVSFCRHKQLPRSETELVVHRRVHTVGSHWVEPDPTSMLSISIELNDEDVALREGITINLEEIYNLKPEVKVAVIGRVRPQDWRSVRQQINHLFGLDSVECHASNGATKSSRKHSKDEPSASVARQRSTRLEPDSRKKRN